MNATLWQGVGTTLLGRAVLVGWDGLARLVPVVLLLPMVLYAPLVIGLPGIPMMVLAGPLLVWGHRVALQSADRLGMLRRVSPGALGPALARGVLLAIPPVAAVASLTLAASPAFARVPEWILGASSGLCYGVILAAAVLAPVLSLSIAAGHDITESLSAAVTIAFRRPRRMLPIAAVLVAVTTAALVAGPALLGGALTLAFSLTALIVHSPQEEPHPHD